MANSRPPVRELRHATPGDGTRRLQSPSTRQRKKSGTISKQTNLYLFGTCCAPCPRDFLNLFPDDCTVRPKYISSKQKPSYWRFDFAKKERNHFIILHEKKTRKFVGKFCYFIWWFFFCSFERRLFVSSYSGKSVKGPTLGEFHAQISRIH